ncbi:MAG: leucyl aminopeptidase [Myxococcota bacterium]
MKITVDSRAPVDVAADLLCVPLPTHRKGKRLPPRIAAVDRAGRGAIAAVLASGDFAGKVGQTTLLYGSGRLKAKRLQLVGLGDAGKLSADDFRKLGGRAVREAVARKAGRVAIAVPPLADDVLASRVQALAEGCVLAGYRLDDYKGSEAKPEGRVAAVTLLIERGGDLRGARAAARRGDTLADCQNAARRLSDMPANELPPALLATEARRVAREVGLKVKVLEVPALERNKMGGILAVGGGSAHPPRLIVLEHTPKAGKGTKAKARGKGKAKGKAKAPAPFCIVGKGITFDSGGISIKPSAGMDEMKHDMSGAAAVVGAMRACAVLDVPYPVVGVIGAAENMPSGTAYRPGDVVTAMSGKTIEVLNTDAEGRVVLADALHYARTEYEPCAIVDLATLTGACMIALGPWATGVFGNHDGLIERIRAAGVETAELAWPMPLLDAHKEEIRSRIADIKNTGGREAGASTAAAFLSHFVGDTPWVHLDIAGTGWTSKSNPYHRGGATGVGVRLLIETLAGFEPAVLD